MFARLVISIMLCASLVGAWYPAPAYGLTVEKLTSYPKTDPLGYWAVVGMQDWLLFESIESGMGISSMIFRVHYQSGSDALPSTSPVEVSIGQLSARTIEIPDAMLGVTLPKDTPFSWHALYYDYFSRTLGITTVTVEVLTSGDTIEATGPYTGIGVMSSNAENTKITFTNSEPDEYLNPRQGTSVPAFYPPILSFPTFMVSDHDFNLRIKVYYRDAEPDWLETLYTDNVTLTVPGMPIDMGITDVFSLGFTAATIDSGVEISANGMGLEPGETHVTLGFLYSLSEMRSANIDLTSMHLYRHEPTYDTWVLAGKDGNINNLSGVFVAGAPTDQVGDYGIYINEAKNHVLVWANIDNPSTYTVGGTIRQNIQTLQPAALSGPVALESPDGTKLTNASLTDTPSPDTLPSNVELPDGVFGFNIVNITPGGGTTVTITLPSGEAPSSYYKYGPTPADPTDHWYEFLYDEETGAEINNNVITLHFVDGKRGDSDLDTTNGSITDPGAAVDTASSPPPAGDDGDGGSGGGGCFITTMFF